MKKPNKKRSPGNPGVVDGERQKARSVSISDRIAAKARKIGGRGGVSAGIRIAVEAFVSPTKPRS